MPCPEFLVLGDLVKQVRTPPVRPEDGVVGCVYESFVPGEAVSLAGEEDTAVRFSQGGAGYHSLLLRRKMSAVSPSPGRFSPGRKTPPGVPAPSTGLRPLNVSRVKCGDGPCRGHAVLPCTGNTICLHCAFIKGARFGICLRKHVVAATGPSPFKFGGNQRPERTMSGAAKTSA